MSEPRTNQKRTAIIYFGATKQDYLSLVEAKRHKAFLEYIQPLLSIQLKADQHHEGCADQSHYTIDSQRDRHLQGWLGSRETLPICRVRCDSTERSPNVQGCGAVFTVLPSFILRYCRQDADCLEKLLETNLAMGLTLREAASIYSWMGIEHGGQPSWVWTLVVWGVNLKDKRFRFTNALKFEDAPAYSAPRLDWALAEPLDRSMRFLDEKLQVSGQFRANHAIDPMRIVGTLQNSMPTLF